jgi:hypothetical protein
MVLEVRIEGVEKKFALGTYPGVSLAAARKARDAAKAQKASWIKSHSGKAGRQAQGRREPRRHLSRDGT